MIIYYYLGILVHLLVDLSSPKTHSGDFCEVRIATEPRTLRSFLAYMLGYVST